MSSIQVIAGNISEHQEAVELHHRFMPRMVGDVEWEFSHLEAFVMKVPININPSSTINIDVIILLQIIASLAILKTAKTHPQNLFLIMGLKGAYLTQSVMSYRNYTFDLLFRAFLMQLFFMLTSGNLILLPLN